jgi:hypothetical protein
VGTIRLQLGAVGDAGIVGWALRGIRRAGDVDGLATSASGAPERPPAPPHPNGAIAIDHVVARTPDLPRTLAALEQAGLRLRRMGEAGGGMSQAFYVVGDAVLEVVGPPEPGGDGPAAFWGLVATVEDLDATCAGLGELVDAPRDAVQRGRRIAVVGREAGLGTALALMSPRLATESRG